MANNRSSERRKICPFESRRRDQPFADVVAREDLGLAACFQHDGLAGLADEIDLAVGA